MGELVIGLAIAAISGLTFVAYRHPKGYGRLFPFICGVFVLCGAIVVSYHAGLAEGLNAVTEHIPSGKIQIAEGAIEAKKYPVWADSIILLGSIYATFLAFLPDILGIKEDG